MTHFTVLVKYEGSLSDVNSHIETMLAPFDENTNVAPYKEYFNAEAIRRMAENYKVDLTLPAQEALEKLVPHMQDWDGAEGGIEVVDGTPKLFRWSTYNPQSKWDWYELGGRWQGMLRLHVGKMGVQGRTGVPNREDKLKNCDAAYLKDVDFVGMTKASKDKATESYYKAVDYILKELKAGKSFNDLTSTLYWDYGIEDESLEDHVARYGNFSTHAVLDGTGWHEWSKMGWWAVTYDENETEVQWAQRFAERFLSNTTDNTVIAVVDCHI